MTLSRIKYAALCLTHNCNLRCTYCYAGEKQNRRMSSETARRAVDFVAEHSDGPCAITFFGGEPMLEFPLIREIVAYSRERHGRRVQFRMSTNGTLVDRAFLEFCRDHEMFFVLSIDGTRDQHDRVRRFADGGGSYERIAGHVPEILAFNPYTIAVSVIVPETVPFVAEGARHLFDIGFRYVLQTLDYSAPWGSADLRSLKKQYASLSRFYFDALAAGRKLYYSPFDERIKTWAQKPYGKGDLCDLANTQIAIAASGRIYPCVQFVGADDASYLDNAIGDVRGGFDESRRAWFVEENYRDKESCAGCALDGRCATYCGCVNWRTTGSLASVPPVICEHERMLMPVVDRLANKLWKHDVALFERKFYDKAFPLSSYIEDCMIKRRGADAAD
jgi:uncharacterized protein